MKESYWGYWLILLGIFVIIIMLLVQNITSSNTQDYYLIKEITEASMIESVDLAYYRDYGEVRIIKEKFVENFVRRFAESADLNKTYTISFSEIYEAPPKVSVKVSSRSNSFNVFGDASSFETVNKIDEILEVDVKDTLSKAVINEINLSGKDKEPTPGVGEYADMNYVAKPVNSDTYCLNRTAEFKIDPKDASHVKGVAFPSFTCTRYTTNKNQACAIFFPEGFTDSGWEITGWVDSENRNGAIHKPGEEFDITSNKTYYAVVVQTQ